MNLIFLDPSDEFLTQVVNIGIPEHVLLASDFKFQNEANKISYELTREVTIHCTARFLRRLVEPEEFQNGHDRSGKDRR